MKGLIFYLKKILAVILTFQSLLDPTKARKSGKQQVTEKDALGRCLCQLTDVFNEVLNSTCRWHN